MTESLFQKIKMFNRDIEKLVEGEEVVKEKETRLYNKLRDEFKAWVNVLTANTQKGKSRDSVPKAESRTPSPGSASRSQRVSGEPGPTGIHTARHRQKAPPPPSFLPTHHLHPSPKTQFELAPPGWQVPPARSLLRPDAVGRTRVCALGRVLTHVCTCVG